MRRGLFQLIERRGRKMGVSQLGYLVLDVADIEAWRDLATGIIGAELRGGESGGPLRLRFDDYERRMTLRPAKSNALVAIGWEVASLDELEAVRGKVAERGIAVTDATREEVAERGVQAMIRLRDLDGAPLEIYYGPTIDDSPLKPSRPLSGFVCGALGLGHVVLVAKDRDASVRFYREVLGFSLTDTIRSDQLDAVFLHCNPRHHSLALMNECYGMTSGYLNHFMLETRSIEDVGRAYDLVRSRKLPLSLALGQHSNDRMTSFYVKTPSGFSMEYGWGGVQVDAAAWQVGHYETTKLWGHESVA